MADLITVELIRKAATTIAPHVLRTPTVASPGLRDLLGVDVTLKLETLQHSGCFKPRGITNKVLSLSAAEREAGLVTVSGGNHGLAVSRIAAAMGIRATVVMPESAPARSKATIRANGATLRLAADAAAAFEIADQERDRGVTYLHAYDDPLILAGHGTLGLEFIADAPELTDVLVSIGGGGLISGVATAVKAVKPAVRIWGVETVGAEAMTRAIAAGRPVPVTITSIAATLGAPIVADRTLAHARALVEDILVVDDAAAVAGVLTLAEEAKLWVEPAAGCLIPAARQVAARVGSDAALGLVLCGGNASFADITAWAQRFHASR